MAGAGPKGGGTRATAALDALGVEYRTHVYDPGSLDESLSVGEAVAQQLGFPPDRLFKTLITTVDSKPVCAVVPTSKSLSLKALAKAAGGKRAMMAGAKDAERWTGYVTGGISPVGQTRQMPRFIDKTAQDFETIVVSAGKRGLQIELGPDALTGASAAVLAQLT